MAIATWSAPAPTSASMRNEPRLRCTLLSLVAALACAGSACKASNEPPPPAAADAAAHTSGFSPYLLGGARVPRFVHWSSEGDLLVVAAHAIARLPQGSLATGARLVETSPDRGEHNLVSALHTRTSPARWLIGGNGFVSVRDPSSLTETRRLSVVGNVQRIDLAADASVAVITACASGTCRVHRVDLATGNSIELGVRYTHSSVPISADGRYVAFEGYNGLRVFVDEQTVPIFSSAADGLTLAFKPDHTLLWATGSTFGRWDPVSGKATETPVGKRGERAAPEWKFAADSQQGAIVASGNYEGQVVVHDGSAVPRRLQANAGTCQNARVALEDPSAIECGELGGRFDAAGVFTPRGLGAVVAVAEQAFVRLAPEGCEVIERVSGKILGWGPDLCAASFSPDGTRLAWIDGGAALRVHALADVEDPADRSFDPIRSGTVQEGALLARFTHAVSAFDARGFRRAEFTKVASRQSFTTLTPDATVSLQDHRLIANDYAGKSLLRVLEPGLEQESGNRIRTVYASGQAVVTAAYGREPKTAICRFGASCTEVDIAPASAVVGYEAPWILTTTTEEPDAPAQTAYYLRHDRGEQPLRRVITGHPCAALLLDHGEKLACVSGGKVLEFDTRSGQPLGVPRTLPFVVPPVPPAEPAPGRIRLVQGWSSEVVGHGDASLFVRLSAAWATAIHFEEHALPSQPADAGPGRSVLSTAVIGPDFAVVEQADGRVRTGGNLARAERLLLCRNGEDLLPYSACRAASATQ